VTHLNYPFLATLIIPVGFTLIVLLDRRRPYPLWAKAASLIGCAAGIAWFLITLSQPRLSFARYPFLWSVSIKQFLGGLFLGIFITIILSRASKSKDVGTPQA
jgi:hypothetical protein